MQKIILDTNVIVSSLISNLSYPYRIIFDLVLEFKVTTCISDIIMKEYLEVLQRNKFKSIYGFYDNSLVLLQFLSRYSEHYSPTSNIDLLKDKNDNKFLELAIESSADYIVTGNFNDFNIEKIKNTKIVSPKEYWEKYTSSN